MKTKMSILILLYLPKDQNVGGHILSAKELAKSYVRNGDNVYIVINSITPIFRESIDGVFIINESYHNKYVSYMTRFFKLNGIIKLYNIDYIIPFDKYSTNHASLTCTYLSRVMIPIMPGGDPNLFKIRPLELNNYIVFSKESKEALVNNWRFDPNSIELVESRFSFSDEMISTPIPYDNSNVNVVYITGLRLDKLQAFECFLNEVLLAKPYFNLNIQVFGDGGDKEIFEERVNALELQGLIKFKGFKVVNKENLQQFHLAVTMGRGVIESSALALPVAVCGANGYKGVLTQDNIGVFITSNFTGRNISVQSNFLENLQHLKTISHSTHSLASYVRRTFSVDNLRRKVESLSNNRKNIPFKGSLIKCLLENIKPLINKKI